MSRRNGEKGSHDAPLERSERLDATRGALRGKAFLVGVTGLGATELEVEAHLSELSALADTAGFDDVGRTVIQLRKINAATYIGPGQAETAALAAKDAGADVMVVDEDLSPAQVRNLEKIGDLPVVDRAGMIIEIFAQRARSREAKTQVELARLEYLLPRLAGRWGHLSRQVAGAGAGTKGEGEKQIELDRRMIRRQIDRLKRSLKKIDSGRLVRRHSREGLPQVALAGYTNVGKSSLFNALTIGRAGVDRAANRAQPREMVNGADGVLVENRLFATLDPTVRRVEIGKRGAFLMKDTVGFVRKLPHHLVASFRTTFQETAEADLIMVVVDASHEAYDDQLRTALEVLADSGLEDHPRLLVFNKIDLIDPSRRAALAARHPGARFVSAQTGEGVDALRDALADSLVGHARSGTLLIPSSRSDLVARASELGQIDACTGEGDTIRIELTAPARVFELIEGELAKESEEPDA